MRKPSSYQPRREGATEEEGGPGTSAYRLLSLLVHGLRKAFYGQVARRGCEISFDRAVCPRCALGCSTENPNRDRRSLSPRIKTKHGGEAAANSQTHYLLQHSGCGSCPHSLTRLRAAPVVRMPARYYAHRLYASVLAVPGLGGTRF